MVAKRNDVVPFAMVFEHIKHPSIPKNKERTKNFGANVA